MVTTAGLRRFRAFGHVARTRGPFRRRARRSDHRAGVEDAVHGHQRPELDRYPGHLFLDVDAVRLDPADGAPAMRKSEIG